MSFIQVKNLKKSFNTTSVLKGVNFSLEAKDQCVIQGASGSGKSTFLHILGGLDQPDQGHVFVGGRSLERMGAQELANYRNHEIGLVFQFHFLLPSMNCLDNIYLPARIGGQLTHALKDRVAFLAKRLKVDGLLKKFPFELSGGEQQRMNLIRALSLRPSLLLCDEPTGNLDSENSQNVIDLLKEMAREFEMTVIVVTHDHLVARSFSQQVEMVDGLLFPREEKRNSSQMIE